MRKSFILLGTAAIVALSLQSCNRTEVENPSDYTLTHTVRINAAFGSETKTSIVEGAEAASFKWSEDDAGRFTVTENSVKGSNVGLSLSAGNTKAVISATFDTDASATAFVYDAFLAANKTTGGNPKIPAVQNPTESSFDPDADILVAQTITSDSPQDELSMRFARPVVINKMTIKGLPEGETVSTVKIAADKPILGSFSPATETWTKQGTEITVNVNRQVPEDGRLTVFFITIPAEDVNLTVTATSSDYIYSKALAKPISFIKNQVTVFGVSGLAGEEKEDYSGVYVLTDANATKMASAWVSTANNIDAVAITKEDGNIYYDPDGVTLSEAQITVARIEDQESDYYNMYTLVQNEKYLYPSSSTNNYLKAKTKLDENCYWEITCSDEGVWSIVASKSSNRNVLQNNGDSFACYASASQTAVALYKTTVLKPAPAISLSSSSITLESEAVSSLDIEAAFNSNTSEVTVNAYDDEACTTSSNWLTASIGTGKTVLISAGANNTGAERVAYLKIIASNSEGRTVQAIVDVTQNFAGAAKTYTLDFESVSQKVNVYTSTWNQTCNDFTWTISNFNNNNGGWKYIKCGNKNAESVATIVTGAAISEAIGSIDLTIDAITASKVTSIILYVSTDNAFPEASRQVIECSKSIGTQKIEIPTPTAGCYYKLEFSCAQGSSNGLVTVSSVVYTVVTD